MGRVYRSHSPATSVLRAARKSLGLTQAELGTELGVDTRTILAVEKGESPKARLYHLAILGLMAERADASPSA